MGSHYGVAGTSSKETRDGWENGATGEEKVIQRRTWCINELSQSTHANEWSAKVQCQWKVLTGKRSIGNSY